MSDYYIVKPGSQQPVGPLTVEEIRQKQEQGEITAEYLFSMPGAKDWKPLAQLPGLNVAVSEVPFSPVVPTELREVKDDKKVAGVPFSPAVPTGEMGEKPSNYLILSSLGLLCCWPLAIFAIVKSASVNTLWVQGRYEEAKAAANTAKICNIVNIVISVIVMFGYIALGMAKTP